MSGDSGFQGDKVIAIDPPCPMWCSSLSLASFPGDRHGPGPTRDSFLSKDSVFSAFDPPSHHLFPGLYKDLLHYSQIPSLFPPSLPHCLTALLCAHKLSMAPYCSQNEVLAPHPSTLAPSEQASLTLSCPLFLRPCAQPQ